MSPSAAKPTTTMDEKDASSGAAARTPTASAAAAGASASANAPRARMGSESDADAGLGSDGEDDRLAVASGVASPPSSPDATAGAGGKGRPSLPDSPTDESGAPYFSRNEIMRLYKRFAKLDRDGNGTIDKAEFQSVASIAANPLASRIVAILDSENRGQVDFKDFVSGLSAFSPRGNMRDRMHFMFKVYDIDRDGYISNGELFLVLKAMVGSNLRDDQLQQIVDKSIIHGDLDGDGRISFEEFHRLAESSNVAKQMSLQNL